jgi:hypothetical protein
MGMNRRLPKLPSFASSALAIAIPFLVTGCQVEPLVAGSNTDRSALSCDAGPDCAKPGEGACTPGRDETCNADIAMSALAGKCNANGTCTCNQGFVANRNGRCAAAAKETFPAMVAGTWLIEVGSGTVRSSWVRLEGAEGGRADILANGSSKAGARSLYDCSGTGSWQLAAKPNTVFLYLPAGCATDATVLQTFTFDEEGPPGPAGALRSFTLSDGLPPAMAHKFPDSFCNAAFTSCAEPY